jgi:hypothetical protein
MTSCARQLARPEPQLVDGRLTITESRVLPGGMQWGDVVTDPAAYLRPPLVLDQTEAVAFGAARGGARRRRSPVCRRRPRRGPGRRHGAALATMKEMTMLFSRMKPSPPYSRTARDWSPTRRRWCP